MEEVITCRSANGSHIFHPEMVRIRADSSEGLFEGYLDFEAEAIEPYNLQRRQGQIGAHKDAAASGGMGDSDKADQDADSSDQQVNAAILKLNPLFTIDRTFRRNHRLWRVEESFQSDLVAILFTSASCVVVSWSGGRQISNGINPYL